MDREKTKSEVTTIAIRRLYPAGLADSVRTFFKKMGAEKLFNLGEIAAVSAVYFWVVWLVVAMVSAQGLGLLPLLIILSTVIYVAYISPVYIHEDSLEIRGLGVSSGFFIRTDNLWLALRGFGSFTLAAIVGLLVCGSYLRPGLWLEFDANAFFLRLSIYFLSALGQDALFFGFFLWRWRALFEGLNWALIRPKKVGLPLWADCLICPAVLANALLFSLFHLPNMLVMFLTLIMGVVWGGLFSRTPNLLVAAGCHSLLGTFLNVVLKLNLKMGSAYYWGHKGFYRAIFSFADPIIGGRF